MHIKFLPIRLTSVLVFHLYEVGF